MVCYPEVEAEQKYYLIDPNNRNSQQFIPNKQSSKQ